MRLSVVPSRVAPNFYRVRWSQIPLIQLDGSTLRGYCQGQNRFLSWLHDSVTPQLLPPRPYPGLRLTDLEGKLRLNLPVETGAVYNASRPRVQKSKGVY